MQDIKDLSLPSQADLLGMAREGSSFSSLGEAGEPMAGSPSGQDVVAARAQGWLQLLGSTDPALAALTCFAVLTRPRKGTGALLVPAAEQLEPEGLQRGVVCS